jgi:DhnA family fructose-bisphosphate aldolase class Ia
MSFYLPQFVTSKSKNDFVENLAKLTFKGKHTIMFAADQRVEHLITSFFGKDIDKDDLSAEHFFRIASRAKISALATQLGLIAKYSSTYPDINYVAKINSLTKITKESVGYTKSTSWYTVEDVVEFKKETNTNIIGIGYTVYLGIKEEPEVLKEASQIIKKAHQNGLPVILWVYPKPKKGNELDLELVATGCAVGEVLGADFIKINPPVKKGYKQEDLLKVCTKAAGRTKVLISGGSSITEEGFLSNAHDWVYKGGAFGVAVGRNIHQKSLYDAVDFSKKLYSTVVEGSEPKKSTNGVSSIM